MATFTENTYIVLSLSSSSSTLYCADISVVTQSQPFTRTEYTHAKLLGAPESDGTIPLRGNAVNGGPYQIIYGSGITARNFAPDDSDIDNIYKKLFFNRYTLKGRTSLNSDTGLVYTWAAQHRTLQDQFDHQLNVANGNVSVTFLQGLQSNGFLTLLTNTGLTLVTKSQGTLNNCLIRSFSVDLDYEIPQDSSATSNKILNMWEMVIDQIVIKNASASS